MVALVIFMNNMSKIKIYNNSSTKYLIAGMFFSIIGDICLCSPLWDPLGNEDDRYGDTANFKPASLHNANFFIILNHYLLCS